MGFEQNNRERNDWQNTLNEILELYGIDEENNAIVLKKKIVIVKL